MEQKNQNLEVLNTGKIYEESLIKSLEARDMSQIRAILATYRAQGGAINYRAVLSIQKENRLPQMALKDRVRIAGVLVVGLDMALSMMNLVRPLNENQVIYLVSEILETCGEDNLALEDVMLFLQNLVRGVYGSNYEGMDVPKFMEKFEQYREQRHREYLNWKDEKEASHRPDYSDTRISEQSAREESAKNIAALIEYERQKKENFNKKP